MINRTGNSFIADDEGNAAIALWRAEEQTLEADIKSKPKLEARIYDLYRNNDMLRGLVEKQVDTLVGARVILQSIPDHKRLGVTKQAAADWAENVERAFHEYADSPENWISANQSMNFTEMCRHAARQKIIHGEILASREWRRTPLGYSTTFQMITPTRLKTPKEVAADGGTLNAIGFDGNRKIFEGIEFNKFGAATAYHIEGLKRDGQRRPYAAFDPQSAARETKRYPKATRFGWLQIFHLYEGIKPEYPRGISRLSAVLRKVKQIDRYSQADLDKAIIAASYVFAINSDEDPESIADMLSGVDAHNAKSDGLAVGATDALPTSLATRRQEIYDQLTDRYIKLKGGQIMHLFKGETIKVVAPPVNQGSPSDFRKGHERSIANGMGISYEIGSGDFQGVSFSGGQLSMGVYEHSANIQRETGVYKFAKLVFRSWLDEAVSKGVIPLLGGNAYFAFKEAYAKCTFSGAKRIHIDDVKRSRSNMMDLNNGTASRIGILAENGGDFVQVASERAREAQILLDELDNLAKQNKIDLSPADRMNFVTSVLATSTVDVPDEIGDDEDLDTPMIEPTPEPAPTPPTPTPTDDTKGL